MPAVESCCGLLLVVFVVHRHLEFQDEAAPPRVHPEPAPGSSQLDSRLAATPPCPGWGAPTGLGKDPPAAMEREAFQISAGDAETHFTFIEPFCKSLVTVEAPPGGLLLFCICCALPAPPGWQRPPKPVGP